MERIPKGSKEYLIIDCSDRLGNITTLPATTFDVEKDADDSEVVAGQSAVVVGMSAHCLFDSTPVGITKGIYRLYVQFDNPPESPRLGPHEFEVI